MSLVDVRGYNFIPGMMARMGTVLGMSYATIDADGELVGAVIYIPRTGNISKISIRTRVVTVTDTLKVSIQGIDESNGRPDGVISVSGTLATPATDTTYWVELDSPLAVTMGQKKAIVVEWNDFVGEGSNGNLQLAYGYTDIPRYGLAIPYTFRYIGSVWVLVYYNPGFGIEYDDGIIEPIIGCFPAAAASSYSWDMNDNPDRRGIRFQVPYTCRLKGAFFNGDVDANASLILYSSDGTTPLETITFDSDVKGLVIAGTYFAHFTSGRILTKDTYYRLVLLPTTGTNILLYSLLVTNDGDNKAMNAIDGGVYFHYTTCNGAPTDESDWTQALTARPIMGLVVDKLGDVGDEKTFNLHVRDKDGVDLEGAYVVGEDALGGAFGVSTGADGKIVEQTLTENSPYTFTISKANYETLVINNITADGKKDWEVELLPALAVGDVRLSTVFGESKTGTLDLPAVTNVEKGVVFDSTTKTGTFKEPGIANVKLGVEYGAGDDEFTGTYAQNTVSGAIVVGSATVGTVTGSSTAGIVIGE